MKGNPENVSVPHEQGIHVHCDAVQAGGKIDIDVESLGVDTLSLSAPPTWASSSLRVPGS